MAAVFQQRKEQLIFLINNYDMILSVLMVIIHWHNGMISIAQQIHCIDYSKKDLNYYFLNITIVPEWLHGKAK